MRIFVWILDYLKIPGFLCTTQALVNSTITANMNFTKTSPKFGQWSDHRANTVYGLGFTSEKDLVQVGTFTLAWLS